MSEKHNENMVGNRQKILRAAKKLFRRTITINERAFQSLEILNDNKVPKAISLWLNLSSSLPVIHQLYSALDVDIQELNRLWMTYNVSNANIDWEYLNNANWNSILKLIFCEQDNRFRKRFWLTEISNDILSNGLISPFHIAAGIIRSRWFSEYYGDKVSNPVVRHMARASGVTEDISWNEEVDHFSQKALDILEDMTPLDPYHGSQQFILYNDGEAYRILPFGVFGAYQFSDSPLPDGSLWIARGNLIQSPQRFTEEAICELEYLINTDAKELQFQMFFKKHPEFMLALGGYNRMHPQLIIHEDDGRRLIPDFFLEKLNSDFCDICDLKRPTSELVRRQQGRCRFRDTVMEAVAQLNHYRNWFEEKSNRNAFFNKYGLKSYRPKVVVIIGRSSSFYDELERIKLESSLPAWVKLKTYDDVIHMARQWKHLFHAQ